MPKNIFLATAAEHNARLDTTLSVWLGISRSQVQKLIDSGQVLVNKKTPKKAGDQIKTGYEIRVIPRSGATSESPARQGKVKSKMKGITTASSVGLVMTPKIIAATSDYIVVEKPTGMLTHPTMAKETNTLVDFLKKKYPEIKKVGDDTKMRPGIVHRLDKEASGILVVGRTQKMFNHLKDQFKARTIEKEYLALAHGRIVKDWDIINFPIARSGTGARMAARPLHQAKYVSTLATEKEISDHDATDEYVAAGEKDAKTEFFVEKRFVNFTLLRVVLHTGRMHQIRVHMLAYNTPLVGDPLYHQIKRQSKWDAVCGRLFLHSAKLGFTDLAGEKKMFESALPPQLTEFLKLLK